MSDLALETGLLDRALRRVTSLWRDMAERVVGGEAEGVAEQMRACLDGRGGEVSARHRAGRCQREGAEGELRADGELPL